MEYSFWMDGAESLIPSISLPSRGADAGRLAAEPLLGRRDTPRDESWRKMSKRRSIRAPNEVYRDLRAGRVRLGLLSRWLRDITRLASIRTTQFIPIDLNAFLFKLENTIANLRPEGRPGNRGRFSPEGQRGRAAVTRYLWDDESGCFRDYDWRREQLALFSPPASSRCTSAWRPMNRPTGSPTRYAPACSPPAVLWRRNIKAVSSGISPTAGRRCSMAVQGFKMYGQDPLGDEIPKLAANGESFL